MSNLYEYIEANQIKILGYCVFISLWSISLIALKEAGKMKYGIIPCIFNWIGWKVGWAKKSPCLEWFENRKFYLWIHPVWILSSGLAITLLSSLYEGAFRIRTETTLTISILSNIFLAAILHFLFKHIRKHEPYE